MKNFTPPLIQSAIESVNTCCTVLDLRDDMEHPLTETAEAFLLVREQSKIYREAGVG